MAEVFFSIVTVVRNNLSGLIKTKVSIEQQVCRAWEWIIVDGNSTDATREFALGCAGPNVKVTSESDRGIYDAMNKGIALTAGRYIIFMNSGDSFVNNSVLCTVHEDLLGDPVDVLFGGSTMRFGIVDIPRPSRKPDYIWHGQPGMHQATVFLRQKHLEYPYNIEYNICGDYDVITRMWADGLSFRSTPTAISANEFVADATSGRHKVLLVREAMRIQRNNLRLSVPKIVASAFIRLFNSGLAKLLTFFEAGLNWQKKV